MLQQFLVNAPASWVAFLTSLKLSFLFCVARQMFRVSKCCIFMPIQRLSVDSQIRSQCFLLSLVLSCGFLINFQRCHVFFVVSNSTTLCFVFVWLSRTKISSNIQPPSTFSSNIIQKKLPPEVQRPPSSYLTSTNRSHPAVGFHTFLYFFGGRYFCGKTPILSGIGKWLG